MAVKVDKTLRLNVLALNALVLNSFDLLNKKNGVSTGFILTHISPIHIGTASHKNYS